MMLAGGEDTKTTDFGVKFQLSKFGWKNGLVSADTPALTIDGSSTLLPKGALVRVYVGKVPQKNGAFQSPSETGNYYIELAPPPGGFWRAYNDTPEAWAVVNTAAYAADSAGRSARVRIAPLAPKDLGSITGLVGGSNVGTADAAVDAMGLYDPNAYQVDAKGIPVIGPDGKPVPKTDSTPPPPKAGTDSNVGLLALLGIGALALLGSKE